MRLRWVCLVVLVLLMLLEQLAAAQRRNNKQRTAAARGARSLKQSRIAGGVTRRTAAVRRTRPQTRIRSRASSGVRRANRVNRGVGQANRVNRGVGQANPVNRGVGQANPVNRSTSRAGATDAGDIQARIVGGSTASISTMPYLVQLLRQDSLCGGSLIKSQWVLTAAHCVSGYDISEMIVVGGTSTQNGTDGVHRTVIGGFVAPKFTKSKMNMDAALLKLNETMTGTNIGTIALGQRVPRAGSTVRIGGWGSTKQGGESSLNLRAVQVKVVKQKRCKRDYKGSATITNYMFCARGKNKDSCSGDSGGGAVQNNQLMGIVSFGSGCAQAGYPGVYTRVGRIRRWINNIIANN